MFFQSSEEPEGSDSDADLSYNKEGSKWEFGVGVTNLLNDQSIKAPLNVYTDLLEIKTQDIPRT